MKRTLLAATLAAMMIPAQASVESAEQTGLGWGVLIGALLGGPAGAAIGGLGGGLIGRAEGLEAERDAIRARNTVSGEVLSRSQREQADMASELARLNGLVDGLEDQLEDCASSGPEPVALPKDAGDSIARGMSLYIQFRLGSAVLESHYAEQLRALIIPMQRFPSLDIVVEAHTDRSGEDEANRALSQRRLQTVARVLREAGIDQVRIRGRAVGESQPLSREDDSAGAVFDRRVRVSFRQRSTGY